MSAAVLAVHALAGAVAVNAVPHLVSGLQGRRFPSPFASPPGRGLSSPMVNAAWGAANVAAAWALAMLPGQLDLTTSGDALAVFAGGLAMALMLASHFGRVMAARGEG